MCPTSALDFELSGQGETVAGAFALKDVQQAAVDAGFVKSDVGPEKPLAQRADLAAFFKTLGVSSLSGFKRRFYAEKLPKPRPGMTPLVHEKVSPRAVFPSLLAEPNTLEAESPESSADPTDQTQPTPSPRQDKPKEEKITWTVPPVSEFPTLAAEWTEKNWRMLPKPGGAVMKPEDWYVLWGAQQQVERGDNRDEKPMWAPHGGLDFDGRERWEKWERYKGMDADAARLEFVKAYGKAMSEERAKLNFRAY